MVEIVLNVLSAIGVVAFSVAGALVAIDHRVDMFGVVTLAAITSFGGGLTRDLLMGKLPPTLFTDRFYLVLAGVSVLTALVVCLVMKGKMKSARLQTQADAYITQDSLRLTRQDDRYITTTQTRVKIETAKSGGTSVNSGGFSHSSGKF